MRARSTLVAVIAVMFACAATGFGACDRAGGTGIGPTATAVDLDGAAVDPFAPPNAVTVLVFLASECPISNRYAPELRRIHGEFSALGVRFWLVYPSALDTAADIRKHVREYELPPRPLRDPEHVLVRRAGARRTPEAAVFTVSGGLAYSGRIDDRYVDFGKARAEPARRDLEEALRAVLHGEPVRPPRTEAVGCTIAP